MVLSRGPDTKYQTTMDICQTLDGDVVDMATRLHLQLDKIASQYSEESIKSILPLIGRAFDQLNDSVCIAEAQSRKVNALSKELIDLEGKLEKEVSLRKEAELDRLALEDTLVEMRLEIEELAIEISRYREDIKSRDVVIYSLRAELEDTDVQIKELQTNGSENVDSVACKMQMRSAVYSHMKCINEQITLPLYSHLETLRQSEDRMSDFISLTEQRTARTRVRKLSRPKKGARLWRKTTSGPDSSHHPLLPKGLSNGCEISIVTRPKGDRRHKMAAVNCRQVPSIAEGGGDAYDGPLHPAYPSEAMEPVMKMLRRMLDGQDLLVRRFNDIETKLTRTATQVRSRSTRPAWWPFPDMSPQTVLFLLVVPLVAHVTLLWLSGGIDVPGVYFTDNVSTPGIHCTFDV